MSTLTYLSDEELDAVTGGFTFVNIAANVAFSSAESENVQALTLLTKQTSVAKSTVTQLIL